VPPGRRPLNAAARDPVSPFGIRKETSVMKFTIATLGLLAVAGAALAAPTTYNIDPAHTYPAFEADHMGGLSLWRGKFNKTTGKIVLDVAAKTGEVDITIDTASLDFGHDGMTDHAKGPDMFDVARYPTAT